MLGQAGLRRHAPVTPSKASSGSARGPPPASASRRPFLPEALAQAHRGRERERELDTLIAEPRLPAWAAYDSSTRKTRSQRSL
ncbi:hypothetical protein R6Z07F_016471 [Ovis aries]